jgi:hypothetical protein
MKGIIIGLGPSTWIKSLISTLPAVREQCISLE